MPSVVSNSTRQQHPVIGTRHN